MIKPIIQIGDPKLNQKSKLVTDVTAPEIQELITDLIDTCEQKAAMTAGLSAPQLGVNLSVIVCRRMDIEEKTGKDLPKETAWEVMINPKILKYGNGKTTYWEGCLSVGVAPAGLFAPVTRADSVDIEFLDKQGVLQKLVCKGFFAHIVQHEIDHLEGVIFLSYVQDPSLIWKNADLDKYYDVHGEYPPI